MTSRIKELVERTGFHRELALPYLLTSLTAPFAIITLLVSVSEATMHGSSSNEYTALLQYSAVLAMGYVLGTTYLSYRATKLVKEHLFLSGLSTYVRARESNSREAVSALFRSSMVRREIPSPLTSLVLNIVTLGFFFPILLHVLESNVRKHARGEETLFFGKSSTEEIGFSTLLLDLSAIFLTLCVYLVLRTLRFVRVFNRHVEKIHSKPQLYYDHQQQIVEKPLESPLLGIALVLIGTGAYALLSLLKLPIIAGIGYFFAFPVLYTLLSVRDAPLHKQIATAYAMLYMVLCTTILLGFLHSHSTIPLAESFRESIDKIHGRYGSQLTGYFRYIFINNFAISVASMVSTINPLILFNALGNAGLILGGLLHKMAVERGSIAIVTMLLFLVWPHVLLELLSYGIFLVIATNITRWSWRKTLALFSLSVLTLAVAAFVESLTIVIGTMFTQQR